MARRQRFTATLVSDRRQRVFVPVPFDPDQVWGEKTDHHIHGTVNGMGVRGVVEPLVDGQRPGARPGVAPRLWVGRR